MNYLIVTDTFPPEIRSSAILMYELADFISKENNVDVITLQPNNNLSSNIKLPRISKINNLTIHRLRYFKTHNINYLLRGFLEFLMPVYLMIYILIFIKKIDFCITYSPPIFLGNIFFLLKKIYKAKIILNVQDIFPQNAIDLGIIKNKLIIKFLEYIEKKNYKNSDLITFHSIGNRNFFLKKNIQFKKKTYVLNNWVKITNIQLEKNYKDKSKLRFIFGGVLGPSQGLKNFLKGIIESKNKNNLILDFYGNGTEKKDLMEFVKSNNIHVNFYNFLDSEKYDKALLNADIGLVSLSSENKTPVVPGKLLVMMSRKLPIFACTNLESDVVDILKKSNSGVWSINDQIKDIANKIDFLFDNFELLYTYSENSYKYCLFNFDKNNILNSFLKKIKDL